MDYVKLGNTGMKVSPITLGTMQFGWRVNEEESFKIMDKALELGINFFDTADIYSRWSEDSYAGKTEEIIGRWLKDRGVRDDLVLATKLRGPMSDDVNNVGLSRRHVHQAMMGSLKRLKTDWVDLYQIHSMDNDTPIEETLHAMNILIDEGIVNYIGASNIFPWQLIESLWQSDKNGYQRFETLQPPYSIARRFLVESQFSSIVKKYNIGVIPYSPLGGGFLTGRYVKNGELPDTPRNKMIEKSYFTEKRWSILDAVKEIGERHGASIPQIAIAWVMEKDFITSPIIGANTIEQLEENIGATKINLSKEDVQTLDQASDWQEDYDSLK